MNNETVKKATVNILLDIGAISTDGAPYTLSSGVKSPVYVDIRKIISYPTERYHIFNYMVQYVNNNIGHYNFDVIAGGESAGIPFASMVANRFNVPLIYVRKEPKKYGGGNQIEGTNYVGKKVLLIEDLMSFGSSKAVFVDALRKAGAIVEHILVIFDYGIAVDLPGISIHSMTNFITLLEESQHRNYWDKETTDKIHKFLQNAWSNALPSLEDVIADVSIENLAQVVENYVDGGIRHKVGATPKDFLKSFLRVSRQLAYATSDGSWAEFEKEFAIIVNRLVVAEAEIKLIAKQLVIAEAELKHYK